MGRIILGVSDLGIRLSLPGAIALVERFWDLGGRAFDTAHIYAFWVPGGLGTSETRLSEALASLGIPREEAFITTKAGHPDAGPGYPKPDRYLSEESITADLEHSLERLRMDRVDGLLLHRDDPREPIESLATALGLLVESGRVGSIGISNWPLDRVQALWRAMEGPLAWQNQGSLAVPDWQETADPTMRRFAPEDFAWSGEVGVECQCYSALSNGFFSGGEAGAGFDGPISRSKREAAAVVAAEIGATPTQVALAWLLAQGEHVRPVIGTTRIDRLEEAMIAEQIELTEDQRITLDEA